MRGVLRLSACLLLLLVGVGCVPWPTEQGIVDSLERSLRSVTGEWAGQSFGANAFMLEFRLREDSDGRVTGTGHMTGSGSVLPITVSGTYRRPVLVLTFIGMQYEGKPVQGTLEGEYTSVGGISTTLQLTGTSASRTVDILLQEE